MTLTIKDIPTLCILIYSVNEQAHIFNYVWNRLTVLVGSQGNILMNTWASPLFKIFFNRTFLILIYLYASIAEIDKTHIILFSPSGFYLIYCLVFYKLFVRFRKIKIHFTGNQLANEFLDPKGNCNRSVKIYLICFSFSKTL